MKRWISFSFAPVAAVALSGCWMAQFAENITELATGHEQLCNQQTIAQEDRAAYAIFRQLNIGDHMATATGYLGNPIAQERTLLPNGQTVDVLFYQSGAEVCQTQRVIPLVFSNNMLIGRGESFYKTYIERFSTTPQAPAVIHKKEINPPKGLSKHDPYSN